MLIINLDQRRRQDKKLVFYEKLWWNKNTFDLFYCLCRGLIQSTENALRNVRKYICISDEVNTFFSGPQTLTSGNTRWEQDTEKQLQEYKSVNSVELIFCTFYGIC